MSTSHRYVLISAGGAGTRLWPRSRANKPKQFQKFFGNETLIQHMARLALGCVPVEQLCILTTPDFADVVREQIPNLPADNLILEPERRDNGPALALAMLTLRERDPEATVAILWSDHLIRNEVGFAPVLNAAFAAAAEHPDKLVTVGTKPTSPDPTLGYIQMGHEVAEYEEVPVFAVRRFIEKPPLEQAQLYARSWEYLWNVGYKVMSADGFITAMLNANPELNQQVTALTAALGDEKMMTAAYSAFPKQSIEYLLTEHLKEILVVPADIGWSDLGNWNILHEISETSIEGNVVDVDTKNCFVRGNGKPIVMVGTQNLIVVDDGDALLILDKSAAGSMKEAYTRLAETYPELL